MSSYCLRLETSKDIDVNVMTLVLCTYLPVPESQAEQISILLNRNKTIEIFTGYSKSDLEKYQKIISKTVKCDIVKI